MLERIFNAVIDGVYEGFKWHTAFIICALTTFSGEFYPKSLMYCCIIFSIAMFFNNEIHTLAKWKRYVLVGILGVGCGLVFYQGLLARIVGIVFYGFVFYYLWFRRQSIAYFDDELIQSGIVVGIGVVLTIFAKVGTDYAVNVNRNVLFFVFYAVLYLVRLHIMNEYDSASLSISKRRNIMIFDLALIIFAIVFIVAGKNALAYLPHLILYLVYAIVFVLTYIWRFLAWLMFTFQKIYLILTNYAQGSHYEPDYEVKEPGFVWVEPENFAVLEEMLKAFDGNSSFSDIMMSSIIIAFTVITIFGLIYFAVVFWPKKHHEDNYVFAKTEKEFIFNPKEMFKERHSRRQKYLTTSSSSKVRKEYAKKVSELHDKHKVVMEPYMTPNEFARIVHAEHQDDDYSFSDLTRKYNEVRYKENE